MDGVKDSVELSRFRTIETGGCQVTQQFAGFLHCKFIPYHLCRAEPKQFSEFGGLEGLPY